MFENLNLDAGGDAAAESSSTPDTGAVDSGTVDTSYDTSAFETPSDSGATDAPADISLTTQQTQQPPAEGITPEPETLTDEQQEAALQAAAADPATPQWARAKITEAMGYANRLKEAKTQAEQRAQTLEAQYQGREALAPADIERMKASEDTLMSLQSLSATPEVIEQTISQLNPRAYDSFRAHTVWNALQNPDGTPNLDNLQAVVDRFAGEKGAVSAKDVLLAVDALKQGRISPDDFHSFSTPEEYEAFQRTQAHEQELAQRASQLAESQRFQETQIRSGEISRAATELQSQVYNRIAPLVERFRLTPQPNEPKVASDYKALINERIASVVSASTTDIPALGEISKAYELLAKAGDKPVDAQQAVAEIQQFVSSPQYQTLVARGMSELQSRIEKVVAEEAARYSLMMEGYAARQAKAGKAPPVPGAPNQSANIQGRSPEELARMTAQERTEYAAQQASIALRNMSYGNKDVNRLAG